MKCEGVQPLDKASATDPRGRAQARLAEEGFTVIKGPWHDAEQVPRQSKTNANAKTTLITTFSAGASRTAAGHASSLRTSVDARKAAAPSTGCGTHMPDGGDHALERGDPFRCLNSIDTVRSLHISSPGGH